MSIQGAWDDPPWPFGARRLRSVGPRGWPIAGWVLMVVGLVSVASATGTTSAPVVPSWGVAVAAAGGVGGLVLLVPAIVLGRSRAVNALAGAVSVCLAVQGVSVAVAGDHVAAGVVEAVALAGAPACFAVAVRATGRARASARRQLADVLGPAAGPTPTMPRYRVPPGRAVLALLALVMALLMVVLGTQEWLRQRPREQRSRSVPGTVVDVAPYHVRVRYRATSDTIRIVWFSVEGEYHEGQTVPVHVDPQDPTHPWLEPYDLGSLLGWGFFLAVYGSFPLVLSWTTWRRQRRVLADPSALVAPLVASTGRPAGRRRPGVFLRPESGGRHGPFTAWVRTRRRSAPALVDRVVEVRGDLWPGGAVVLVVDGTPVVTSGRLRAVPRPPSLDAATPTSGWVAEGTGLPGPSPAPGTTPAPPWPPASPVTAPPSPAGWVPPPVPPPAAGPPGWVPAPQPSGAAPAPPPSPPPPAPPREVPAPDAGDHAAPAAEPPATEVPAPESVGPLPPLAPLPDLPPLPPLPGTGAGGSGRPPTVDGHEP